MAKKNKKEKAQGAPKWMVTFSDMTTLLLTFFVLLISLANFDKKKIEQVFGVLNGSTGILSQVGTSQMSEENIIARKSINDSIEKTPEKIEKMVKEFVQAQNMEKMISVVKTDKGVSVRVVDSVFFGNGSAVLLRQAYPVLDKILDMVQYTPYYVNVEGHTDDLPMGRAALSNWDLSAARAVAVAKYFIRGGFDPSRISASGYGEFHPVLPNITPENRAKNRRVEINIISPEFAEKGANVF